MLGTFGAIDTRPRQWTADDLAILEDLAAATVGEIELRLAAQAAAEQAARLEEQERERALLFDSFRESEERLRSELMAIARHELRTPLTSLIGFAELLLSRELPPNQREDFLRIIVQEGQRPRPC